ncbi:TPA: helix-turn-helix domain-containing protein [Streptococcus agalactiae]
MNRLKELRKEKKLTQEELAGEIGVSKITILRWENGERQIKPDKAKELAKYFNVSVGYLLGYAPNKKIDFQLNLDGTTLHLTKEQFLALENTSKSIKKIKNTINESVKQEEYIKNASKYYDFEKVSRRLTDRLFEIHTDLIELLMMLDHFPSGELSKSQQEAIFKFYKQLDYFVTDTPASFDYFKKNLESYGYKIYTEGDRIDFD